MPLNSIDHSQWNYYFSSHALVLNCVCVCVDVYVYVFTYVCLYIFVYYLLRQIHKKARNVACKYMCVCAYNTRYLYTA